MSARLIRPSYFVWLIVPLAGFAVLKTYGLPHVIWSYEYRGNASGSVKHHTGCFYVGPYGGYRGLPARGRCAIFKFIKANGRQS